MAIDYEKELNKEQYGVVMGGGGPMLVIAGAGSGKTRTLTYRVARLIEIGQRPEGILLATFTNKAAREMLSRVEGLTALDISRLWGGTFHRIANRVLRRQGHLLGYGPHFTILDADDARQLLNASISELRIDAKTEKFPKGDVLADILSFHANTGESLERVVARRYPFFSHRLDEMLRVSAHYGEKKRKMNLMDFDDLLVNWLRVLKEHPRVLDFYAEKFVHLLVDEYQDTNALQAEILDLLSSRHRNLMVVGDDSQSIYSFRGANFTNILKFPERYPDVKLFKLETNYRSTPEILALANLSILNNREQFQKALRAVREEGVKPVLVPLRNASQQAHFVSQRVIELIMEGVPLHEIAVLYRAHHHSMELQMEMTRRGIPFEIRSGIRFFEQAHIKDVTAYLRLLVNPFDETAWKRVLLLYDKIGKTTAEKIWRWLSARPDPLSAARSGQAAGIVSKGAQAGYGRFVKTLETLSGPPVGRNPGTCIETVVEAFYRDYLREHYSDSATREEDLMQLALYSTRFEDLESFLGELALLTTMTEDYDPYASRRTEEDRVILSSIHQAKGLEWTAVFIIWCAEGMMPLARALQEPGGEEEERRLFYVGTTRAKDHLYLCYPLTDYSRGMGYGVLKTSRFIEELETRRLGRVERPYQEWVIDEA
ncbi:MAG TPA: ATP-dependent helicase [Syntrophales bacterium]|nr:ATP-dependent helicase [Syntrophales bacterium]HOX94698.1 ATP-dependent helicase [Syntrophales bacterium]HPI55826.1 ATP-dependent helicase [Syntrophales bacterium]HPN23683.1 ATP-dependent helicase [Syntrophales bacterium]HQM27792.1 ATP-dependent helicase [Syntrophales bacterium]